MRRLSLLAIACLIALSSPVSAQVISQFGPLAGQNIWTGTNAYQKGVMLGPVTVSELASLTTYSNIILVSDGTPGTSPCAGSGTGAPAAYYNGVWNCLNSGASPITAIDTTLPITGGPCTSGTCTIGVNGATTSATGVVELAGDMAGIYTAPTVINLSHVTNSSLANSGLVNPSLTIAAGTGLTGGGTVALGSTTTLSLASQIAAGTCTLCDLTFNAEGQITVASSGSGGSGCVLSGTTTVDFLVMFTTGNPDCTNSPLQYNSPELYDSNNADYFHMGSATFGGLTNTSGFTPIGGLSDLIVSQSYKTSACANTDRCAAFFIISQNGQTSNFSSNEVTGQFIKVNSANATATTSAGGLAGLEIAIANDGQILSLGNILGINAYVGCDAPQVTPWAGPGTPCAGGDIPYGSGVTITNQYAVSAISNGTATTSVNAGLYAQTQTLPSGGNITAANITWDADLYADSPISSGTGGTVSNHAGIYIAAQNTNSFVPSGHSYGIYQAGTDVNYLSGPIVDAAITTTPSSSPICPNGTGGQFTTTGCLSGGGTVTSITTSNPLTGCSSPCTSTATIGLGAFGASGQSSVVPLTGYGSTASSDKAPWYHEFLDESGTITSFLYGSTTFSGVFGISSSTPTTDLAAGSVGYSPGGINDIYTTGSGSTTGLLQCLSGTNTVADCASNAKNFVGVSEGTGNSNTRVKAFGLVTVNIPSSTTTAGDYICSGTLSASTYNALDNGSTQCSVGQQVGFAATTNGSAVTSVKVQLTSANGVTGGSGNVTGPSTSTVGYNAEFGNTSGTLLQQGNCQEHDHPIAGSSDQISSAGAFATTASVTDTCMAVGTMIVIRAHGVFTTTSTSSPKLNFEVNAGGTTGICPAWGTNTTLTTGVTDGQWDIECRIQINTTGSPGTAIAWGESTFNTAATGNPSTTNVSMMSPASTSTSSYTTTASETVSIQETATLVSGQTLNLTALDVMVTY